MARANGSLIKRGDNSFLIRVYVGIDTATGKRSYKAKLIQGSRSDARRELRLMLEQLEQGGIADAQGMTVNAYLDRWLKESTKHTVKARTLMDYEKTLNRYIRPALGKVALGKLTALHVQAVYSSMLDRGLSSRTVRMTNAVFSSALKQAMKWRFLTYNPAADVSLPAMPARKMRALSEEDALRFLGAAHSSRWGALFALALSTGMRPGEYRALRWQDIDLDKGVITIQRAISKGKEGNYFSTPKTTSGVRQIPIPPGLAVTLKEHKRSQAAERLAAGVAYQSQDLVFANGTGGPIDSGNLIQRHFKAIIKAAGLPKETRLYDLRHSFATLNIRWGVPARVVQARLGHKDISMTLGTYTHVLPSMDQEATDMMQKHLFSEGS